MRHQFTPVFRDFLTSSMWATDPATRCVWLWFLLTADPEGYVVGTVPGVAQQAGVTLEQAKAAIELLESPDPYSSTPDLEGRRVVKVQRGWHIVNFVAHRERAKQESEKARKRAWAKKAWEDSRQLTLPGVPVSDDLTPVLDASSESLDAPKPIPIPKPKEREEISSPQLTAVFVDPGSTVLAPTVLHRIPEDWQMGEELVAAARAAGVQDPVRWFNKLKLGPIGGSRGVFAVDLSAYIRDCFGKWRTWEETDRAKASQRAATGAPKRFGSEPQMLEPTSRERAHAGRWGYDIDELFRALNEQDVVTRLGREGAREEAKRRMAAAAKAAKERAA